MEELLQNADLNLVLQLRNYGVFGYFDFVDHRLPVTAAPFPERLIESLFVEI